MKKYHIRAENRKYIIKDSELKYLDKGGTAEVYLYKKDGKPKAIKLYNDSLLDKHKNEYKAKLNAMLNSVPENITFTTKENITFTQFAWPEALVEDAQDNLLGYVMPALPDTELYELTSYIKEVDKLDEMHHSISYRIQVAYNLARAVHNLHKAGHFFIDMKTQNIFVFKDSSTICFIDCDGFSINQGQYKAEHYSKFYVLPDALRNNHSPNDLSDKPYQDYYCLAHLIFEILEFGRIKPFDGIPTDDSKIPNDGDTYEFKVKERWYPYGSAANPNINPHPNAINDYFPESIRKLFEKAFTGNINEIPDAEKWAKSLYKFIKKKGHFEKCAAHADKRYHDHFKGMPCFGCEVYDGKGRSTQRVAKELLPTESYSYSRSSSGSLINNVVNGSDLLSKTDNRNKADNRTNQQIAQDESDWAVADRANTIEGYQNYLKRHPKGKYASSANTRIFSLYE